MGERLTVARKVLGRTQAEFARQAQVSVSAYNQYERGRKRPTVDNANRLCDAFRFTLIGYIEAIRAAYPMNCANGSPRCGITNPPHK
jgi:transcriptional regulator with XRE-family HTH domain